MSRSSRSRSIGRSRLLFSTTTAAATTATTTTSATTTVPFRIVSRRAWNNRSTVLSSPTATGTFKATSIPETPWPRSVLLGRNVALSLLVPYSFAWFLSIHSPSRTLMESILPGTEALIRKYLGSNEEIPYPEVVEGLSAPKQLPSEPPQKERHQVVMIQKLLQEELPVLITTTTTDMTHTMTVPGNLTTTALMESFPTTGRKELNLALNLASDLALNLALDFPDLPLNETTTITSPLTTLPTTTTTTTSLLNQKYHTFSSWYYQAPLPTTNSSTNTKKHSPTELEVMRLEYVAATLEAELSSITSTRNIDDMQQELANAKSQLRRLRWKKWLRQ
jgi:hypothetical protein